MTEEDVLRDRHVRSEVELLVDRRDPQPLGVRGRLDVGRFTVEEEMCIRDRFQVVRRLQASGIGIIYISHRLKEIFELADEVTVLKDGRYVDTRSVADVDMDDLVKLMIGRDLADVYPTRVHKPGDVVLQVSHLSLIHISGRRGPIRSDHGRGWGLSRRRSR